MCGIAGIISLKAGSQVDKQYLNDLNRRMVLRGPDHSGFWYSHCNRVGFAHNRLSFIDLHQRSNQPLQHSNGRYVITYNGEIYNYKELRRQLVSKGHEFNTFSDTEVIMAMYDCYGSAMLNKLKGMFAFAIWDNQTQKLFAARDPFGIKPFYFAILDNEFVFCSQVKPMMQQADRTFTPSPAGWCGFLLYGSVPEPFTVLEQIKALPAGHSLEVGKDGKITQRAYYSIYDEYLSIEQSRQGKASLDKLSHVLAETVDYHLVADVPVGLLLSAGIDSNVIAYFAKQSPNQDVKGFTIDFEEFGQQQSETELAALAADKLVLEHQAIKFNFDKSAQLIEAFFCAMDQPSIDGLNVWMISKFVNQAGYKAILSGLGGDELFAGYPSFTDVPRFARALKLMQKLVKSGLPIEKVLKFQALKALPHPKLAGFASVTGDSFYQAYRLKRNLYLKQELREYFESSFIDGGIEELEASEVKSVKKLNKISNVYLKVSALEMDNYMKNQLLKDADWASMNHSLELRVPFVDRDLIRASAAEVMKIKRPQKKSLFGQIMPDCLPEQILSRNKTGFETPLQDWLHSHPELQHWKTQPHLLTDNTPWARRWAFEVKSRFLN